MSQVNSGIAVVTGTSSGIGFATALHLARNGFRVFAAMRKLEKGKALLEAAKAAGVTLELVELDVTSIPSVERAFAQIAAHGPIEVLVNNAGIGAAAPLEEVPEDEHREIFETNYFGTIRCIQAVLPGMRERRRGVIANVTSVVGIVAMPNQIPYSASKWALECLGEALAHELVRFNVRVVNIEPGVIMTAIFENSAAATRYDKHSPYQPLMRRSGKMYSAGFKRAAQPQQVADAILEAITTPEYKLRWPVGEDADGFAAGRPRISDEAWVAMGGDLTDEDYNRRFFEYFAVRL